VRPFNGFLLLGRLVELTILNQIARRIGEDLHVSPTVHHFQNSSGDRF